MKMEKREINIFWGCLIVILASIFHFIFADLLSVIVVLFVSFYILCVYVSLSLVNEAKINLGSKPKRIKK